MIRNDSRALMKLPYLKVLWLTVNVRLLKLGLPKMALMIGVMRSAISAWMTALNATPITTATARSTRFPRSRNFLKPSIHDPLPEHARPESGPATLRPYQRKTLAARGTDWRGAASRAWRGRKNPVRRGGGHRHHEGMAWTLTEDLDDYYAAGDFVASHPVQNTIQLTAAETVRSRGRSAFGPSAPLFGWWSQGGRGTAALLHTPPYPVLLTSLPGDGAESLAVALAGRLLPGVNVAESDSVAFAAAWSKNTGMGWRVFRRSCSRRQRMR